MAESSKKSPGMNKVVLITVIAVFCLAIAVVAVKMSGKSRPGAIDETGQKAEQLREAMRKVEQLASSSAGSGVTVPIKYEMPEDAPPGAVIEVKADGEDPAMPNTVYYVIPAISGNELLFQVSCSSRSPDAEYKRMALTFKNASVGGKYTEYITTREGKEIEAVFDYTGGPDAQVTLDADTEPDGEETLYVPSKGGHDIAFRFARQNGQIEYVSVLPLSPPYIYATPEDANAPAGTME